MATSQSLKAAFSNVPSLTKALVTTLIAASSAGAIYTFRQSRDRTDVAEDVYLGCPYIGLLPGIAIYTPWTIITAIFYETNVFSLVFSALVLLLCGKYLERAWGSKELLTFIAVTASLSNIVTWFGLVLTYYLTSNDTFLYNTQVNGMAGVFAAFLVAFRHLIPEHRISLFGNLATIRVKNLVGVATAVSIVCLILFQAVVFYNLVNIGWIVGWIYIRFFQYHDGIRGDHSETFALVTFFPEFLHPIIGFISNTVYGILVSLRCCTPAQRVFSYDLENQTGLRSSPAPLPGSARAEAERRRALALKALDMRLSNKPAATPPVASSSNSPNPTSVTTPATGEPTTPRHAPAAPTPDTTNADSAVIFDADKMQSEDGDASAKRD